MCQKRRKYFAKFAMHAYEARIAARRIPLGLSERAGKVGEAFGFWVLGGGGVGEIGRAHV